MTSKYGYASEGMEYCRTSRPLSLSAARGLESARTYPIGNRVNPHASLSDNDNDKDKSRRRIAVACSRCRKRKIKCTGDLGNGQGCLNCKNAGTDPQLCQFLRVSSINTDYGLAALAPVAEYPYPLVSLSGTPTVNPGSLGGLNAYTAVNPTASMPGPSRLSRYSIGGTPYPISIGSSPEYYGYGGGEGSFEPYNYHPAAQIQGMHGHEAVNPVAAYASAPSHEPLRQWAPGMPQAGRAVSTAYEEKLHAGLMSNPPLGGQSAVTHGTQQLFPAMSALASSLPVSGDRVLPTPTSSSHPSISSEASMGSSQGYNSENSVPIKNDLPWAERDESLSTPTTSGPVATASSKSLMVHTEDQKRLFPYAQYRNSNTSQSSEASSAPDYGIGAVTTAGGSMDEHVLSSSSFGSGSYTYSLPSSSKRPSGSEGTLLNGQPYTPLPVRPAPVQHTHHHHHHHPLALQNKGQNENKSTSRTSLAPVPGTY